MAKDPLANQVEIAAGLAFNATFDGSPERAAVLSERARGNVKALLDSEKVGPIRRWKLWRLAEAEIRRNAADIIF